MNEYKKLGGDYRDVDGKYRSKLRGTRRITPARSIWSVRKNSPKYKGVLVCEFQEFAEAFYTTYHPDLQLDKDILCFNQGISARYYPETMWHIPGEVNMYVNRVFKLRENLYGISRHSDGKKWQVQVRHNGKAIPTGKKTPYQTTFKCPVAASRQANIMKRDSGRIWANKYPEYEQFAVFVEKLYVHFETLTDEFEKSL